MCLPYAKPHTGSLAHTIKAKLLRTAFKGFNDLKPKSLSSLTYLLPPLSQIHNLVIPNYSYFSKPLFIVLYFLLLV